MASCVCWTWGGVGANTGSKEEIETFKVTDAPDYVTDDRDYREDMG